MRLSWLFAVSGLVAADQVPLQEKAAGWMGKAKSFIPGNANPIQAGAAVVASQYVEKLTKSNWQQRLTPKPEGEEEWLIYMTGGNKTCFGRCTNMDIMWNESVALMVAQPRAATDPVLRLGEINCEVEEVICTGWGVRVPSIYHIDLAKKSVPQAKSPLHCVSLNTTTTTVGKITSVPSSGGARFEEYEEYTGFLHPVDGSFRQYGLLMPFGYFLWGFGSTPGWLVMIVISFFSRQIMTKKALARTDPLNAQNAAPAGAARPAQARAAPVAPVAAAARAGGKKRK